MKDITISKESWLRGHKTFFILNSLEHDFFLLINIKMPTIIFISRENFMLSSAVQEESLNYWYLIFFIG